jgi:hypothetical protein
MRSLLLLTLSAALLSSCVEPPVDPNCDNPTARCEGRLCQSLHPVTKVCEATIQCDRMVCAPGMKCNRTHLAD